MLLICPTCRSGLEVPDGTTAHVRCPACRTVFAAADGAGPPPAPIAPPPPPAPIPKPNKPPSSPRATRPKPPPPPKAAAPKPEKAAPANQYVEFQDAAKPKGKRRRRELDGGLTPAELAVRNALFQRGVWGSRLIWSSLLLYCISMMVIALYFIAGSMTDPEPAFLVLAGVIGMLNWTLGAIGIGLCLAGPQSPGHFRYGVSAAIAAGVHLVFLGIVFAVPAAPFTVESDRPGMDETTVRWLQLPTQLEHLMLYMRYVVYPEQGGNQKTARVILAVIAGAVEMSRLVLVMMLLSCVARAAGDEPLSGRCVRAAGVAAFVPGATSVLLFGVVAILIETNGQASSFGKVIMGVTILAVYMFIAAMAVPALSAARDTAEACEFPFQAESIDLAP